MGEPLTLEGWKPTYRYSGSFLTSATQGGYTIRGRWSKGNPNNWVFDVTHPSEPRPIARGRRDFEAAHKAAAAHQNGKRPGDRPPPPDPFRPPALRALAADLSRYTTEIERAASAPRKGRSGYPTREEIVSSIADDIAALVAPYRNAP